MILAEISTATHFDQYLGTAQAPDRNLHFNLLNEAITLANTDERQVFTLAQNQVMHHLSEHILGIKHPFLKEDEKGAYSYKLVEATSLAGSKYLMPAGYDNKTSFVALCANPYLVMAKRMSDPDYKSTPQDIRVFRRCEAEMIGATLFQQLIVNSDEGAIVVWSSPPGDKQDGYWDSSITFLAEVEPRKDKAEQREVRCYRCINNLSIAQQAFFLNSLRWSNDRFPLDTTTEEIVSQPIKLAGHNSGWGIISLINYLYSLDGQKIDIQKALQDPKKLAKISNEVSPQIESFSANLRAGNAKQADKTLSAVEAEAMSMYFPPKQLYVIAFGESQENNFSPLINYSDLLGQAYLARRQEMFRRGTSCPGVANASTDPISGLVQSFDPHQALIDRLINNSSEDTPQKCPKCKENKGKLGCCANCPFRN